VFFTDTPTNGTNRSRQFPTHNSQLLLFFTISTTHSSTDSAATKRLLVPLFICNEMMLSLRVLTMRIPTVVLFVFIMFAARRTNAQVTGLGTNSDGSYLNTEQAQTPLLIQVEGQPGFLNEFEYSVLEDTFVETYNALTERLCPAAAPPITVYIERDVSTYDSPGDGTVSRIYTLKSQATIPNDFPLFSTFGRRNLKDRKPRRLHVTRSSKSGKGGKGGTGGYVPPEEGGAASTPSPTESPNGCPGLTEQAFTSAFREGVRTRSSELGTSVTDVVLVAEMKPATCDANSEFSSDVIVSFTGDPSLWTPAQQEALAQSFAHTYRSLNGLNPDSCDLLFRDVTNVTIYREGEFRRRLSTGSAFSYLYRTTGTCRGCQRNSRLFAQGVSGRMLLSNDVPPFHVTDRRLQNDTCSCPVTATQPRAPTAEEFQAAYEESIVILQQENVIDPDFIHSVVQVNEVQQVTDSCPPIETFETFVEVELFGTESAVTADEIEALELGFTTTYVQLSARFCDPFFRTPIEVVIDTMTVVGRRLQSGSRFKYGYQVTGTCRGCSRNPRLFGQSVGRMLTGGAAIHGRRFQEDGLCFCSIDSLADRAPTENEFAVAYNETVKDLNLPNVLHVVSVEEQIEYEIEVVSVPGQPVPAPSENKVDAPHSATEIFSPIASPNASPIASSSGALEPTTNPTCNPQ
jgi:hypothetical protein